MAPLDGLTGRQASWILRRLRVHGPIKKVAHSYKYYLTKLGRRAIVTALNPRELVIIPGLGEPMAAP